MPESKDGQEFARIEEAADGVLYIVADGIKGSLCYPSMDRRGMEEYRDNINTAATAWKDRAVEKAVREEMERCIKAVCRYCREGGILEENGLHRFGTPDNYYTARCWAEAIRGGKP